MDWSLVIFLVVILFFVYRGFRKGLLKSIGRILSVVAGYVCAILYTGQVSGIIESEYQLQGIVAFIAASLLLFFRCQHTGRFAVLAVRKNASG